MRENYPQTNPCPCSSGELAINCCLRTDGTWQKKPSVTTPPPPVTGIMNPECYLSEFKDCSRDISREHYISSIVLSDIEHQRGVKIAGLPWIPAEQFRIVGKNRLVSKILCRRHNTALSPLDAGAGRFIRTIGHYDSDFNNPNPQSELSLFCGEDLERWMLKTVCGMVAANQVAQQRIPLSIDIPVNWIQLLTGAVQWPPNWGLYITIPKKQTYHSISFEFIPKTHPETNQVLAADFVFHGLQFSLLLGTPDHPSAWGVYRPRTLIFRKDGVEKMIEVSWLDPSYNSYAEFTRTGTYAGEPPDWPEWARSG